MRIKNLTREAMLRNINGLSYGDKAYCGPYGTIKCVTQKNIHGKRTFSVSGTKKLRTGGNWTMSALRKAIVD